MSLEKNKKTLSDLNLTRLKKFTVEQTMWVMKNNFRQFSIKTYVVGTIRMGLVALPRPRQF